MVFLLRNIDLHICECRYLREMCNHEYLMAGSEARQLTADRNAGLAAHSCVDFVEDQGGGRFGKNQSHRQHPPCQLAAGSRPSQWPQWLACICRQHEGDVIGTLNPELRRCHIDPEASGWHRQRSQVSGDLLAKGVGRCTAQVRQLLSRALHRVEGTLACALQIRRLLRMAAQLGLARTGLGCISRHVTGRLAVLSAELAQLTPPNLNEREAIGIIGDTFGANAQLMSELGEFGLQ